ncbi:MAG: hypothetical protein J6A69_00280 [Clostridia bacterium]|nr:hypothetical protein [Clostridia bacterium]
MKKSMRIIVSVLLLLTTVFSLAGCGEIKKAERTVNDTFTALKALDFETASEFINIQDVMKTDDSDEPVDLENNVFLENIFDKLEYEIISSEKIDKNTVIVRTKITAVDMAPVLQDFLTEALQYAFANAFADPPVSDEEMNKKMEEIFVGCINKEDLTTVTNEVDIKVVKVDKVWKIEVADELSDALLGGFKKAAEEISDSLGETE